MYKMLMFCALVQQMQIFVKNRNGKTITLEVKRSDTIYDIKARFKIRRALLYASRDSYLMMSCSWAAAPWTTGSFFFR